jgi:hypothetical protein
VTELARSRSRASAHPEWGLRAGRPSVGAVGTRVRPLPRRRRVGRKARLSGLVASHRGRRRAFGTAPEVYGGCRRPLSRPRPHRPGGSTGSGTPSGGGTRPSPRPARLLDARSKWFLRVSSGRVAAGRGTRRATAMPSHTLPQSRGPFRAAGFSPTCPRHGQDAPCVRPMGELGSPWGWASCFEGLARCPRGYPSQALWRFLPATGRSNGLLARCPCGFWRPPPTLPLYAGGSPQHVVVNTTINIHRRL